MKVQWLPNFAFEDLYFKGTGFQIGYNLNKQKHSIPISIGIGYLKGYLNLGKNVWTDETGSELGIFESKEWYDAYSIGVNFSKFTDISFGLTYKSIVSKLGISYVMPNGEIENYNAHPKAVDLGFLLTIPFHKLYSKVFDKMQLENTKLSPISSLSIGIANMNIGDEVYYMDRRYKDPLPRQAKIGYGVNLGLNIDMNGNKVDIFKFQYSSEANDELVKIDTSGNFKYEPFPGEINIFKNIIDNESNSSAINRNGFSFEVMEFIKISRGK